VAGSEVVADAAARVGGLAASDAGLPAFAPEPDAALAPVAAATYGTCSPHPASALDFFPVRAVQAELKDAAILAAAGHYEGPDVG
jgi:hypothetical protein